MCVLRKTKAAASPAAILFVQLLNAGENDYALELVCTQHAGQKPNRTYITICVSATYRISKNFLSYKQCARHRLNFTKMFILFCRAFIYFKTHFQLSR